MILLPEAEREVLSVAGGLAGGRGLDTVARLPVLAKQQLYNTDTH